MEDITFSMGVAFFIGAFFGVVVTRVCDKIFNL